MGRGVGVFGARGGLLGLPREGGRGFAKNLDTLLVELSLCVDVRPQLRDLLFFAILQCHHGVEVLLLAFFVPLGRLMQCLRFALLLGRCITAVE